MEGRGLPQVSQWSSSRLYNLPVSSSQDTHTTGVLSDFRALNSTLYRMLSKVLMLAALLGASLAQDYGNEDVRGRAQPIAPNYVRPTYSPNIYEDAKSEPYDFGFQSTDEYGTVMNRQEASDNSGVVRGSYGYTDPYGVFRHVDYIADEYGFRAQVKSNEPGMGSQSPANVEILAEAPPAGVIVDRPHYVHPNPHPHPVNPVQTVPPRRAPAPVAPNRQTRPQQAPRLAPASPGPFPFVPSNQNPYPSAATASQYPAPISQYPAPISHYPGPNPYPSTNPYLSNIPTGRFAAQSSAPSTASSSSAASSSSSAASSSAPSSSSGAFRYPVGNPYLTNIVKTETDKVEGAAVIVPTVVKAAGVPTLVKHIHTYPVTAV